MRPEPQQRRTLVALLTSFAILFGHATRAEEIDTHQHAHVHGVAKVGIAVDRNVLTIQFESLLDSLIGFEHRPNTLAERATVESLQARMRSPDDLFRPTPAARCTMTKAEAASALFEPPRAGPAAEEHADLDASFEFRCEQIDSLQAIETALFVAYPRLRQVEVEAALPKGQFKRELKRPARTITLTR